MCACRKIEAGSYDFLCPCYDLQIKSPSFKQPLVNNEFDMPDAEVAKNK
jgi:hypothetical protein